MKTMFIPNNTIVEDYFLPNLLQLEETIFKNQKLLSENTGVLKTKNYQTILKLLKPQSRKEYVLNSVVINELLKVENLAAEGSYYTLLGLVSDLSYEQLEDQIKKHIEPVTVQTIEKLIEQETQGYPVFTKVLKTIIELAGLEYQIVLTEETTKTDKFLIEVKSGYWFDSLKSPPCFKNWVSNQPTKLLLVDGSVERVSELENIFLKTTETKQPLLIIAQGFSEEVIATVLTNNEHGRFNVCLLRVDPSLEGLNVLNDLTVISGADVVSALKGQQIIWIDYHTLPVVEGVTVNALTKQVCLTNSSTERGVIETVNQLILKRDNTNLPDIRNLLDKRIKTLLSKTVLVKLPELDELTIKQYKTITETTLRKIKTLLTNHYGVVNSKGIKLIGIESDKKTIVPVLSLKLGWWFGQNLKRMLLDKTGGVVLIDD
jgi:hypothetical protein